MRRSPRVSVRPSMCGPCLRSQRWRCALRSRFSSLSSPLCVCREEVRGINMVAMTTALIKSEMMTTMTARKRTRPRRTTTRTRRRTRTRTRTKRRRRTRTRRPIPIKQRDESTVPSSRSQRLAQRSESLSPRDMMVSPRALMDSKAFNGVFFTKPCRINRIDRMCKR